MVNKGRIIFVNGYWMPGVIGRFIIKSAYPGKKYWLNNFEQEAELFFNLKEQPHIHKYIDASSVIGIDMNGPDRYNKAFKEYNYTDNVLLNQQKENKDVTNALAYNRFIKLTEGMDKLKHCFYIVTHSEGGAYGAGLARILLDKGWKVEMIIHLSTDEANEFDTPAGPITYQLGFTARKHHKAIGWGDWVTSNRHIRKGVSKSGIAYRRLAGIRIHNKSRCGDVFNYIRDLQTVEIKEVVDKNSNTVFEQVPGTTNYGTQFTAVNGIWLAYEP